MFKTGRWKQMSINRWMDKLWYIQQWNTTPQQKGWTIDIHRNMDGYQKHNTELKKPYTGYIPYDSIYMKLYRRQNWSAVKSDHCDVWGWVERDDCNGQREIWGGWQKHSSYWLQRWLHRRRYLSELTEITHLKWVHLVWIFHRCVLLL